jgi:subtilase family serine protease
MGQTLAQPDRVPAGAEATTRVRLAGHLPRWATAETDAGPVPAETPLHLTFVLSRGPEQQAAFERLLADQQDPNSPRYHQWLTPQQVGELYGPTQHDTDALTAWLTASGFVRPELSVGRVFLSVDATAGTAAAALSTGFRYFTLAGKPRLATTQEPALPAGFAGIVEAIDGLADAPIEPGGAGVGVAAESMPGQPGARPRYTLSSGSHYIAPADFAAMFDVPSAYSALTGAGQRIAVIGRSRVVSSDITEFEANTGLGANLPNVVVPPSGVDPGLAGGGDETEATIDVTRTLGTAPDAQVDLVIQTQPSGGIFAASQYAVNTLNDPVLSLSFGSCELNQGSAGVHLWDTLWAQAAAQGISVFVSSSDSGAATCDTQFATPPAVQTLSINYICASSYATCVGGTELAENGNSGYWSSSSSYATLESAIGYIPEGAWNEPASVTNGVTTYVAAASGGGASLYIPKPAWQTGLGVPADGARDVPDVAFPAAAHDGYYACYAANNGDCANGHFEYFYGTSTAAPTMAAIAAILDQRMSVRQGNLNPALYKLAATFPAAFHDTTVASSGVVGCSVGTASMCNNSTPSASGLTGGLAGYVLTPGYDQVTGLGSLDVGNTLGALGPMQVSTSLTLSASSLAIYTGSSITVTGTVAKFYPFVPNPTGYLQFLVSRATQGSPVPLTGSTATSAAIPFSTAGSYTISAVYTGDTTSSAAVANQVLTVVVSNPGFSISPSPASIAFAAGGSGSATVTYTSLGGFSGTVAQSCVVTYQGYGTATYPATCSFTTPTVTLPAAGSVTGTLTIGSTVPHRVPGPGSAGLVERLGGVAVAAMFFVCLPSRGRKGRARAWPSLVAACAIGVALLSVTGCGGKSAPVGTSAGNYSVAITSTVGGTQATTATPISLVIE